jgi:hypothetical protein
MQDHKYDFEMDEENNIKEIYPKKVEDGDVKLQYEWVFWEQFQPMVDRKDRKKKPAEDKFYDNMRKVGYFNTAFGYCKFINAVPHSNLLQFFYDYMKGEQYS